MTDQTGSPVPQGDSKTAARLEPSSAGPASGKHIASLDGLRGVAVLMVMASHYAGSMSVLGLTAVDRLPFRLGWAGVDVFFALPGFLITGILLDANSFGLYVWHLIIAVMLHFGWALVRDGQGAAAVVAATLFAATLAMAWLSFHAFEKRFLALKARFGRDAPPEWLGRRVETEPLCPAPTAQ